MSNYAVSELQRRLANMIRVGVVAELDPAEARVRVKFGEIKTRWLPWVTRRASEDRDWWAPEPGEQVIVLAPMGELAQGIVLPAINQNSYPPPGDRETLRVIEYADGTKVEHDRDAKVTRTTYPDGTVLEYDATNSKLTANVQGEVELTTTGDVNATVGGALYAEAGSSATVKAPTITLDGDVNVTGDVNVAGTTTSDVDVIGGGKSLKSHTHLGVTSGSSTSGPPA